MHLFIATRNTHKSSEFADILGPGFSISDLSALPGAQPVEETGSTFEENAALKALAAARIVPGLVIADDSGLQVDALAGAPGVYSARYAGRHASDRENVAKLLAALASVEEAARTARFYCALAVAREGRIVATFIGTVEGRIAAATAGAGGFGYDPVFMPEGHSRTFAELGPVLKNRLSHRARAITQLRQHLSSSPDFG